MQSMKQLGIAILALLTSELAMAHPGAHHNLGSWEQLAHFLTSPYHLIGLLALGGLITAVVVWRARRGR